MRKYRRIEITAFRRRVTVVSGNSPADSTEVWLDDTDSSATINTDSAEGQEILFEAVRLLEEKLANRERKEIFTNDASSEIDFLKTP